MGSKSMRVTIATRIFSPEPAAASYRLAALADDLDAAGHSVTVLTTRVNGDWAAKTRPGVRVRRFPVLRDKSGYVRGYAQYMSFDIPLFFRLLVGRKQSIIVTEPPPTTGAVVRVVAALRRTPYVYYAADIWSDAAESTGASRPVVSLVRWLERFAMRGARRVIAVTDGVAERVRDLSQHDRVTVIRNGVDTAIFKPDGPRIGGAPTAVYAGTTSEWQGADIFIRAMPLVRETLPDARLVFVGQGSARAELEQLAGELPSTCVEFRDLAPPAEAAALLRSARAGLVSLKPGQGYDFAVPTKIMASAACGTPVIFAGTGPSFDLVERAQLGHAVEYTVSSVAAAMTKSMAQAVPIEESERLAQWAHDNASLSATGRAGRKTIEVALYDGMHSRRSAGA